MKKIGKKTDYTLTIKIIVIVLALSFVSLVLYGAFHPTGNTWEINDSNVINKNDVWNPALIDSVDAYEDAVDSLLSEGVERISPETYDLVLSKASEYSNIRLHDPSLDNVIAFYGISYESGAKLIISTDSLTTISLKSQLYDLRFKGKIKFENSETASN